jgi:hypothetical protein
MPITAAKAAAAVAIAGVAVLGAQYADAVPAPLSHSVHPNIAPVRNIAHVYSTSGTGGSGEVFYDIPTLPNGVYAASFTANFFPQGTPSTPVTFSCFLTKNGSMRTQSTSESTYTSGFYVGVNGSNTVKSVSGDSFQVGCGTADGSAWTYGTQPLQVTFTRLDGITTGGISKAKHGTLKTSVATR